MIYAANTSTAALMIVPTRSGRTVYSSHEPNTYRYLIRTWPDHQTALTGKGHKNCDSLQMCRRVSFQTERGEVRRSTLALIALLAISVHRICANSDPPMWLHRLTRESSTLRKDTDCTTFVVVCGANQGISSRTTILVITEILLKNA